MRGRALVVAVAGLESALSDLLQSVVLQSSSSAPSMSLVYLRLTLVLRLLKPWVPTSRGAKSTASQSSSARTGRMRSA